MCMVHQHNIKSRSNNSAIPLFSSFFPFLDYVSASSAVLRAVIFVIAGRAPETDVTRHLPSALRADLLEVSFQIES